jgi:AraC-like DNA-binding protein
MQPDLAVFPVPMLTFLLSAVAAGLVLRADLGRVVATRFFAAFFLVLALGSFMVGLRFGYGVDRLVPVQRALPLFAGPLLWLGFASVTRDRIAGLALWHLGAAVALLAVAPWVFADLLDLDLIVGVSYVVYAGGLLWMWSRGVNHLSHARIENAVVLRRWMLAGAGLLVVFALADTVIALSFAAQRSRDAMAVISAGAVVMALGLIAVIVAVSKGGGRMTSQVTVVKISPDGDGAALEARARQVLLESKLYLDTELTVDRLAKRLTVPSRALSLAINQTKGMNVSQYVNDFRLDHAAALLAEGDGSVAEVLDQSGFLTRSNFYREFQRRFGMTPAAYRDAAKAGQSGI